MHAHRIAGPLLQRGPQGLGGLGQAAVSGQGVVVGVKACPCRVLRLAVHLAVAFVGGAGGRVALQQRPCRAARQRQRGTLALVAGVQPAVELGACGLGLQRLPFQPDVACHQQPPQFGTAGSGGQAAQPGLDHQVGAQAAFFGVLQQARGGELHPHRLSCGIATQAVQPVLQAGQGIRLKVILTSSACWISAGSYQINSILQVGGSYQLHPRTRLGMVTLQALPGLQRGQPFLAPLGNDVVARRAQRQQARTAQALQGLAQVVLGGAVGQRGPVGGQEIEQLARYGVALQTRQVEGFGVLGRIVVAIEHHAQALAQEVAGGVAHPIGQVAQGQRRGGLARGQGLQCDRCMLGHRGMGFAPFAGMGEQAGLTLEVARTEGLQRVLGGALGQYLRPPGGLQVVPQLRNQHGGRLLGVVAHVAAGPAHIEHAARRQQCVEHELAVIGLARTVPRPCLAGLGHEVEIVARRAARVVAVVHAQQADHVKGDGPHGHECAEGHPPGAEALLRAGQLQALQDGVVRRLQGQRLRKICPIAGLEPGLQRGLQGFEHLAVAVVGGRKARRPECTQALRPLFGRGGLAGRAAPGFQAFEQGGQGTRQRGIQAAHLGTGFDVCKTGGPAGIAQEHALQAKVRAVGGTAERQIQGIAVVLRQAPADGGLRHPVHQGVPILGLHAETRRQGRHVQQSMQLAQRATPRGQAPEPLHGGHQRLAGARALVSNVEGDVARVVRWVLRKHRTDGGRHGVDVRHHDHNVTRVQRPALRRVCQQLQELVVQHLDLAQGTMCRVELDRSVVRREGALRVVGQGHQVTDAVLYLLQQGRVLRLTVIEQVQARHAPQRGLGGSILIRIELAHEIAALSPPGGQQRMGMQVHLFQRHIGQVPPCPCRKTALVHAQPFAAIHDVSPVVAAGVGNGQQHLAVPRHGGQPVQHRLRHMRHAEQDDAARQLGTLRWEMPLQQCIQRTPVDLGSRCGALGIGQALQHFTPQRRLPAFALGQGRQCAARPAQAVASVGPVVQPIGAIDLVLIPQVGQAPGQQVMVMGAGAAQRVRQRCIVGPLGQRRQQLQQPPRQRSLVGGRVSPHLGAEHLPVAAPQEARGQLHAQRGTDPAAHGHGHLEPFGHGIALHQHHLSLQRFERVAVQPLGHGLGQILHAVAMQRQPSRLQGADQGLRSLHHCAFQCPKKQYDMGLPG